MKGYKTICLIGIILVISSCEKPISYTNETGTLYEYHNLDELNIVDSTIKSHTLRIVEKPDGEEDIVHFEQTSNLVFYLLEPGSDYSWIIGKVYYENKINTDLEDRELLKMHTKYTFDYPDAPDDKEIWKANHLGEVELSIKAKSDNSMTNEGSQTYQSSPSFINTITLQWVIENGEVTSRHEKYHTIGSENLKPLFNGSSQVIVEYFKDY